ncbi:bifunctional phosphoserine phosphatase/homoserine phosphotransferase ThrH [Spirochaeta cellobiosiphila]|uniref:bifunctional phosphoserine phosphatase/homoserine phosphotransferase ThrH n=1 Tax=Spirochaeta cellobiosiphila TaxID=504483 RepID=UPI000420569E|nr:bifunctional phosphoserine phosphatase/homoserine phosphotransferase ThrH [Spirochaeta cellobiosiphila]
MKNDLTLITLDLEGVLVPEIWIGFAEQTGIEELKLTTRDIPDYDELMQKRLRILKDKGYKIQDIKKVIDRLSPLEGAKAFLDELRHRTQVVILSDTFTQFAGPLMEQLNLPTIFCNTLIVDEEGNITNYRLRQKDGKKIAVQNFQNMGLQVYAAGDSFNDTGMLLQAEQGFFFNPPDSCIKQFPQIPITRNYEELLVKFKEYI